MAEQKIINGIAIDEKVAKKILRAIIVRENNNLKTNEKNTAQMVQMIQGLIQEEIKCY